MKKFLSLFAIFAIVLSVSLLFSCDSGSMCCENQHAPASECSTCSPHMESSYDAGQLHPDFKFTPTIIGRIFFDVININKIHVVFAPDRPPTILS